MRKIRGLGVSTIALLSIGTSTFARPWICSQTLANLFLGKDEANGAAGAGVASLIKTKDEPSKQREK
jgi:hypothetical protein